MNVTRDIFLRIVSLAIHKMLKDDEDLYVQDYSKMLYPKDKFQFQIYQNICQSAAKLLMGKKLKIFIISLDTVAFCLKFNNNFTFQGINIRQLSDALNELPESSGIPQFILGTTDEIQGYHFEPCDLIETSSQIEIFPLIDFENVCVFTARNTKDPKRSPLLRSEIAPISPSDTTHFYQTQFSPHPNRNPGNIIFSIVNEGEI